MIRVAIIDDSPSVRRLLTAYLQQAHGVLVVGAVGDADEALELVADSLPDVITLGVEMPKMKGTELLGLLQLASPKSAVVMVSGVSRRAAEMTLEALHQGAVAFHLKFTPDAPIEPEVWERELLAKVRAAGQARRPASSFSKIVSTMGRVSRTDELIPPPVNRLSPAGDRPQRIVIIGGSTGGIPAIERILAELSPATTDTFAIVQHLPAAFTQSLVLQLQRRSALPVQVVQSRSCMQPGSVYVTPGGHHLRLECCGRGTEMVLEAGPPISGHLPSINVTMLSAAEQLRVHAVGILLSGMGSDGADGMAAIYAAGGETMAQDSSTSVIFGMPQRAIERGAVKFIGTPEQITRRLMSTGPVHASSFTHQTQRADSVGTAES